MDGASNIQGATHLSSYMGSARDEYPRRRKKPRDEDVGDSLVKDAGRTLYVRRNVLNADDLIAWAKNQGFPTTMEADTLHVTIAFSKQPVDWSKFEPILNNLVIPATHAGLGERFVAMLGDNGEAKVLRFESPELGQRWRQFIDGGATWSFPEYCPHITISWQAPDDIVTTASPYLGPIVLGPEIFEPVKEDWKDTIVEKHEARIAKIDQKLGLVFGYAIICKVDGEPYYDLNIDQSGARVPEHIPEDAMLKAAAEFMATADRPGNEMHAGPEKGTYVFAFPLTTDIAKSLGISPKMTGLLVAYKPPPDVFAKFVSGEYRGFSIEGRRVQIEEHE